MIKEIGSIFPLSAKRIDDAIICNKQNKENKVLYSLCREALFHIAESLNQSNKTVLIPAYTCQTVITPFEELDWRIEYYPIKRDLRINLARLETITEKINPTIIVVHPYFGMDLNAEEEEVLNRISSKGIKIAVDLTQCLFSSSNYEYCDFKVASYRKWFPIPDGAYLQYKTTTLPQPQIANEEFTELMTNAMYLRGQYFYNNEPRMKSISIKLSKMADNLVEKGIKPHKMSHLAYNLLLQEDQTLNANKRIANFSCLYNNITESNKISKICPNLDAITTAPLYFTIYAENRKLLQHRLADNSIYAPILWPVENKNVLIDEDIKYIYEHLLAIPCDQRYNEQDMLKIAKIINNYSNEN